MGATTPTLTEDAAKLRDTLVERLFMAAIGTLEIGSQHVGGPASTARWPTAGTRRPSA